MAEKMTKQQAAAFLGISERTLERWVKAGKLPAGAKVGREVLFDKRAVELAANELSTEAILDAQFLRFKGKVLNG